MANSIIIRFQPKGDQELIESLKKLNALQGKFAKTTGETG